MKFLRLLFVALGLSFFGWYLSRVGLNQVWEAMRRLGPFAPLVLIPYLVVYAVDCLAWSQTLPRKDIRFLTLLRIRWAGETVNNVLPSAYVGGEAVKVCLLRSQGITAAQGTTAAVVSKTAQTVAQLAFVLIASVVLLGLAQDRPGLQMGVLFVLLCGVTSITALFWVQKVGIFRTALGLLRILPWRSQLLEQRKAQWLHLDTTIAGFYKSHPRQFYASTALYFGGWLLDSFEIFLVAHLLGLPITWAQALVVEAFTGIAKVLGMWVPGSLGVQESGIVLMGRVTGLPDTLSATYALIRRGREAIFAAAGLWLLYTAGTIRTTSQPNAAIQ